jgi:hypothetical protein
MSDKYAAQKPRTTTISLFSSRKSIANWLHAHLASAQWGGPRRKRSLFAVDYNLLTIMELASFHSNY